MLFRPCSILSSYALVSIFFFSSRRRHTRLQGDWSSDVCSSDLPKPRGRRSDRQDRDSLARFLISLSPGCFPTPSVCEGLQRFYDCINEPDCNGSSGRFYLGSWVKWIRCCRRYPTASLSRAGTSLQHSVNAEQKSPCLTAV